jgi:hypothetical protein
MCGGTKVKRKSIIFNTFWDNKFLFALIILVYIILITIASSLKSEKPKTPPVDIVIIFDSSSSMLDEIKGMIKISKDFVSLLKVAVTDFRIGIVVFGAYDEDKVIRGTLNFTNDISEVNKFLSNIDAHGGGYEDQIYALNYALSYPMQNKAKKIFILITDENIGGDEGPGENGKITSSGLTLEDIIRKLNASDITVYTVANDDESYKRIASQTNGSFYHIHGRKKFTDIILDIGEKIVGSITR